MKKTIKLTALVLSLIMMLCFAACSNSSNTANNEKTDSASAESTDKSNDGVVEFNDVTLYEDENTKIQLVKFYEEPENKFVVFKVYNKKTDYDENFHAHEFYLGDEGVNYHNTQSSMVATGKLKEFRYPIYNNDGSQKIQLESLDELYKLNGRFYMSFGDDKYIYDSYRANFSIEEALQ